MISRVRAAAEAVQGRIAPKSRQWFIDILQCENAPGRIPGQVDGRALLTQSRPACGIGEAQRATDCTDGTEGKSPTVGFGSGYPGVGAVISQDIPVVSG